MHVILLVHGMGDFAPGWSNPLQTALKEYYDPAKYAFLAPFPFANEFRFAEITYNQHFVDYLADARTQANTLSKWSKLPTGLSGDVMGVLQRVVDAASHPPADNFLVNYLGDVAFYLASDIGELIKNDVAAQIAAALAPPFDPSTDRWSVIGHSLGTRVVTDVLQAGFTAAPNLRAFGKARTVIQIANVSRLIQKFAAPLAPMGDVYHGAVYPSLTAANGCCTHFIDATHRLDPFAFIEEFDPPADFGDKQVFLSNLYHPVKLATRDITDKNVHALDHYMRHPSLHTTIFRYLIPGTGSAGPTEPEMSAALTDYRKQTLQANITNTWRDSLTALKTQPFETLMEIFELWEKYGQLLK